MGSGVKTPQQRLRDYLRLLSKKATMKPEMVADLEAKVKELTEIVKSNGQVRKGGDVKRESMRRGKEMTRRARDISRDPLSKLRLSIRTQSMEYLKSQEESDRVAAIVLQAKLNDLVRQKALQDNEQLHKERVLRRQSAKLARQKEEDEEED